MRTIFRNTYIRRPEASFTLIELLIVMGIVGVLASAVVVVLNPVELLRRARDGTRIVDIESTDKTLSIYEVDGKSDFGSSSTIYISIPDTSPSCANITLPGLSTGYSYACVTESNLHNVDGTGWIPVDFTSISTGPPISKLPIDPENSSADGLYYKYIGGINWKLSAVLTAEKSLEIAAGDGGVNPLAYEKGKDLTIYPENIIENGDFEDLTTPYSPGWNSALNGTYRPTIGFSTGYNSGVSAPTIGYHAHANQGCGINNSGCFEYIDFNCQYGYCHRWLGTSQLLSNAPGSEFGWVVGTKIKVLFLAKVDDTGKTPRFGLYHRSIASGGNTWGSDGLITDSLSDPDTWEAIEYTFTVDGDWNLSSFTTLYIYGHYGVEANQWIDNVEVTYSNP